MDNEMNLARLLDLCRAHWMEWKSALEALSPEQMEQPLLSGGRSPKDLTVHLTFFEREMVGVLDTRSMKLASPLWELPTDERNQAIFEENRDRALEDVLGDMDFIHNRLMGLLEQMSDADLHDPSRYEGMPAEWVPWQILRGNTYQHYEEHAKDLRALIR
jgi:hypothetical protein